MRLFLSYFQQYYRTVNRTVFGIVSLFMAALIWLNYTIGIESRIGHLGSEGLRITCFFLLFFLVLGMAWFIHYSITGYFYPKDKAWYLLLFLAPLLFALKAGLSRFIPLLPDPSADPADWRYWKVVLNWPLKAALLFLIIRLLWKWFGYNQPVAGLTRKGFRAGPYFVLLLLMIPLILFAASRPDFQLVYPKAQLINRLYSDPPLWRYLLFELCYGSDFFTIELFFRGFLVLAFIRYAGKDAILPVAAFYCSIHFGKPLFECITSYFGGLLLGIVVSRTGTIWGGLIVHLGIAGLMELAGALAR